VLCEDRSRVEVRQQDPNGRGEASAGGGAAAGRGSHGACGKPLLVLDAVSGGEAARLDERLGWVRVGAVPGYALSPQGGLCGTTFSYRSLDG
jgi:hypothetical protein